MQFMTTKIKVCIAKIILVCLILSQFTSFPTHALLSVRIKDIVNFEGVRDNMLIGYGIVVGLNGTGDSLGSSPFTRESLTSMLERLGVNIRDGQVPASKNVAAVMVTAVLPPFARHGSKVDISVSALGDAKDLKGGQLLVTPLLGADGNVYAVGQGSVAVGGFQAQGKAQTITKGVPTSGRIANGAIIEKEVGFDLATMRTMRISLKNPDFTTARRISTVINGHMGEAVASAMDPGTISLNLPQNYEGNMVSFLTDIEQLTVEPDQIAKVVIDDHDGIIVMGSDVRISTIAVSQGSITIKVTETPQVSQPNSFTRVPTATVVDRTDIEVTEQTGKFAIMQEGVTLKELVDGLNALGASPREIISILNSIKAAGALQADIEVI